MNVELQNPWCFKFFLCERKCQWTVNFDGLPILAFKVNLSDLTLISNPNFQLVSRDIKKCLIQFLAKLFYFIGKFRMNVEMQILMKNSKNCVIEATKKFINLNFFY